MNNITYSITGILLGVLIIVSVALTVKRTQEINQKNLEKNIAVIKECKGEKDRKIEVVGSPLTVQFIVCNPR